MKKKNTTLSEQFKIQLKSRERSNIDTPSTQIHDRSHSWLGTAASIDKVSGCKTIFIVPNFLSCDKQGFN
jgi:hypothetical protein